MIEKRSHVWRYFEKQGNRAKCLICLNKYIKCKGGCTSSLIYHLKISHEDITSRNILGNLDSKKDSKGFENNLKEQLPEIISKLVAVDNFSFRSIFH